MPSTPGLGAVVSLLDLSGEQPGTAPAPGRKLLPVGTPRDAQTVRHHGRCQQPLRGAVAGLAVDAAMTP